MTEQTNEEILAEIVTELEQHDMIGQRAYNDLAWPQKRSIALKLRTLNERDSKQFARRSRL